MRRSDVLCYAMHSVRYDSLDKFQCFENGKRVSISQDVGFETLARRGEKVFFESDATNLSLTGETW